MLLKLLQNTSRISTIINISQNAEIYARNAVNIARKQRYLPR